jgi:hypothetical protein
MAKYKNKNGIELSITGNDSASVLIREVVGEAVKICSQYNWHDKSSMRWALQRTKDFLEENFSIDNGKEEEKD